MTRLKTGLVLLGAGLALAGCATITRGNKQPLYFGVPAAATVPGAKVTLSDGQTATLPASLIVKRKDDIDATFSADGYKPVTVHLPHSQTGTLALVGNVVFGGIIGIVVDLTNSSTQGHSPNAYKVTLVPNSSSDNSTYQAVKASEIKKTLPKS